MISGYDAVVLAGGHAPLNLLGVDPGTASVDDVDTPADAQRWTAILTAEGRP